MIWVSVLFRYGSVILKRIGLRVVSLYLKDTAFVLAAPDHGRMVITAANALAQQQGIDTGMAVADARAIISSLQVLDDKPELPGKLLKGLAEWCIRFTPAVAIDSPDGLILDVTGCAHLWGGEKLYLTDIITTIKKFRL